MWQSGVEIQQVSLFDYIIALASFPGSPEREINTRGEPSLVPRLSGTRNKHAWRAWYIFSRDQNRTRIFRTERQRFERYSTSFAFNARCV